ncbi:PD-(D/E)XK nuclease family protein [Thermosynechococcus sp. B0]|uniref:PD-(D/E)XK nuclease family protein n=1 Tax=Thermosynechococcus sp. B0 TaxID=2937284 RepID=UPI002575661D|nr:PD-(D/E)XK nuclease family protein [Thermosynechococcus sp. B0]WJI23879.1 PD-(D/E)XK nuclease family protein [Thermosynechococcus sp. B0]
MQLSQAHLRTLQTCARQYQYRYLDSLILPEATQLTETTAQKQGRDFHRLMQQHFQGLDIRPILEAQPELQPWFAAFQTMPPPMIEGQGEAEHVRSLGWQEFTLVGVYDYVIFGQGQAQILDWKTYAHLPAPATLIRHWQTRLYCYLLAATSSYLPSEISMTYWFAQGEKGANFYTFPYSEAIHQQIHHTLEQCLNQLRQWLQAYEQGQELPQVPPAQIRKYCDACAFNERCQRGQPTSVSTIDPFLAVLKDLGVPR